MRVKPVNAETHFTNITSNGYGSDCDSTAGSRGKKTKKKQTTHLCSHLSHPFRGYTPTQHSPPQVRVLHILQVRDPAPHAVFVFHVCVLKLLKDTWKRVKESNTWSQLFLSSSQEGRGFKLY